MKDKGDIRALRIRVDGRVQGVWFRANTLKAAQDLGLDGWVRNMPDGSVEIHVQGDDSSVDRLLSWCYRGPDGARVDKVEYSETVQDTSIRGFVIRY